MTTLRQAGGDIPADPLAAQSAREMAILLAFRDLPADRQPVALRALRELAQEEPEPCPVRR